jgi:hypothetical protein
LHARFSDRCWIRCKHICKKTTGNGDGLLIPNTSEHLGKMILSPVHVRAAVHEGPILTVTLLAYSSAARSRFLLYPCDPGEKRLHVVYLRSATVKHNISGPASSLSDGLPAIEWFTCYRTEITHATPRHESQTDVLIIPISQRQSRRSGGRFLGLRR